MNETNTRLDYHIDDMSGPPIEVRQFIEGDVSISKYYEFAAEAAEVGVHNCEIYVGAHNYRNVKFDILALMSHFPSCNSNCRPFWAVDITFQCSK